LGCLCWFLLKYLLWQITLFFSSFIDRIPMKITRIKVKMDHVMSMCNRKMREKATRLYDLWIQTTPPSFRNHFSIAQSSYQTLTHNIMYKYRFHMHIFMFLSLDKSSFKH
jgi:hypothetical protein